MALARSLAAVLIVVSCNCQDAYNLGWKLAAVVRGASPDLLDTYCSERLEVAEAIVQRTQSVLESLLRPSNENCMTPSI